MNETDTRPVRRVGTLTMGVLLVVAGIAMLIGMFFPNADLTIMLKLSPLVLIALGAETLTAARGNFRIKYDWVSMILSCLIVVTALCMFAVAWYVVNFPNNTGWIF